MVCRLHHAIKLRETIREESMRNIALLEIQFQSKRKKQCRYGGNGGNYQIQLSQDAHASQLNCAPVIVVGRQPLTSHRAVKGRYNERIASGGSSRTEM